MIFSKQYIKQVIAEEIKNATAMTKKLKSGSKNTKLDHLRQELISIFINYRQKITSMSSTSKKQFRDDLEQELVRVQNKFGLERLEYPNL